MSSEWKLQAACRGLDPEESDVIFFPTAGDADYAEARSYCNRCPVREECANVALEVERGTSLGSRFGMFGALTPLERWARSRGQVAGDRRPVPGINHGTVYGYRKLNCRCDDCAAAYREATERWHGSEGDVSPRPCAWDKCGVMFTPEPRKPFQKYCCDHGTYARNAKNNPNRRVA